MRGRGLGFGAVCHGRDGPGVQGPQGGGDEVVGFELGEGGVRVGVVEVLDVELDGAVTRLVEVELVDVVWARLEHSAELAALAEGAFEGVLESGDDALLGGVVVLIGEFEKERKGGIDLADQIVDGGQLEEFIRGVSFPARGVQVEGFVLGHG